MKMKFESHESDGIRANITDTANKPKIISDSKRILNGNTVNSTNLIVKSQHTLNRQLSDPAKRNIKRTPAFRLDKNAFIEKEHMFQRHSSHNHIRSTMDKFKSLDDSSRLKENCDNNVNIRDSPVGKNTSSKIVSNIENKLYRYSIQLVFYDLRKKIDFCLAIMSLFTYFVIVTWQLVVIIYLSGFILSVSAWFSTSSYSISSYKQSIQIHHSWSCYSIKAFWMGYTIFFF